MDQQMNGQIDSPTVSTLDEPVWDTIKRDLSAVGSKLKVVLLQKTSSSSNEDDEILRQLRDWDLWGPLLVCLALSILLSWKTNSSQGPLVFSAVFFIVWIGAAIVTLNAQLLGGTISFFQSVCVLGYCVFPLTVMAAVILIIEAIGGSYVLLNVFLVAVGFVWSTKASVVFVGQFICPERKALAVYPVFLFYTFLSWMILL